MEAHRKAMEKALKEHFVPAIRAEGFKGSFPHFRRESVGCLHLLTFQFHSAGGSFVVEIGWCPAEGIQTSWGEFVPPSKAQVSYLGIHQRLRIEAKRLMCSTGEWYKFGPRSYDPSGPVKRERFYKKIAMRVLRDFHRQADSWWKKQCKGKA